MEVNILLFSTKLLPNEYAHMRAISLLVLYLQIFILMYFFIFLKCSFQVPLKCFSSIMWER